MLLTVLQVGGFYWEIFLRKSWNGARFWRDLKWETSKFSGGRGSIVSSVYFEILRRPWIRGSM